MMSVDASSSSTSVLESPPTQSLKFVPNGLLSISGTTAIANEEVQVQVPLSSM